MELLLTCDNFISCIYEPLTKHLESLNSDADCETLCQAMLLLLDFQQLIRTEMSDY